MTKRVAIYARVSTREQSPDLQLDALRGLASQRGWTLAGEFVDVGVSGTKSKRPQLDRMMKAVHSGAAAVWKFDRFARSTQHLVSTVHSFYAKRAAIAGGVLASAAKSGAVTVVQRTSSDLRLNPHLRRVQSRAGGAGGTTAAPTALRA